MEKPYGLTMRSVVKNRKDEILVLRRHPKSKLTPINGNCHEEK